MDDESLKRLVSDKSRRLQEHMASRTDRDLSEVVLATRAAAIAAMEGEIARELLARGNVDAAVNLTSAASLYAEAARYLGCKVKVVEY